MDSLPLANHDGDGNEDVAKKRSNEQNNSSARAFLTLYISNCLLQNNNVKSPKFASSANGNRDGKLFEFPFGT